MGANKIFIYFLFSNLALIVCSPSPPPSPEPTLIRMDKTSQIFIKDNNYPLSFRILKETTAYLQIMNSTFTKVIHDDYITKEHTLILVPQNFPVGYSVSYQKTFSFNLKGISLEYLLNTCNVESKDKSSSIECKAIHIIKGDLLYNL
jgi:hypothetical protein